MKITKLLSVFVTLFCVNTFAAPAALKLPVYLQAKCANYAGAWSGFMVNPSDLQAPANQPVTLELAVEKNIVYGHMNKQTFYAQCKNGRLRNIFVGDLTQCGRYSQQGALVGKDVMSVEVDQENAMMDWTWWLFLQRTSTQTTLTVPQNAAFPKPTTCH